MARKRQPLTRERVLSAALGLLEKEGLDGLTMRRLAAHLKVEAMSLYHHVTDKNDLLAALVDEVLKTVALPEPTLPWPVKLEAIALGLYEALLRHPAIVLVLASEQAHPRDPSVLQGMDAVLGVLAESGLPPELQVSAFRGLLAMCFGFVMTHTQGLSVTKAKARESWESWDASAIEGLERLPNLVQLGPQFLLTKAEDDFAFMLGAYLRAIEAATTGATAPNARRRR